jgi:hypothetical protein
MQCIGTQLINERKVALSDDVPKCGTPISRDIHSRYVNHLCFRFLLCVYPNNDIPFAVRTNAATSPSHALAHSKMVPRSPPFSLRDTQLHQHSQGLYSLAHAPRDCHGLGKPAWVAGRVWMGTGMGRPSATRWWETMETQAVETRQDECRYNANKKE